MRKVKRAGVVCSVMAVISVVVANYSDQIRTTERGLKLIGNAEGCMKTPYLCPADILTVGIGTTEAVGIKIDLNREYSEAEIAKFFVRGVKYAEDCVNRFGNGRNMPQEAFEAMTSLTFNVGCWAMRNSTLFKMAGNGYKPAMCNQFLRWVYVGGKKFDGLVKRREQERELCLSSN